MRSALLLSVAGLLLGLAPPAAADGDRLTGRLLVTLRPEAGASGPVARAAAVEAVAARAGARRVGAVVPEIRLAVLRPSAAGSLAALAARLRRDPRVLRVERERRYALRYLPNDPALTRQENGAPTGVTAQWWALRQGFEVAWEITKGESALVAVLDTGIDGGHPELAGRIAGTADFDDTAGNGPPEGDEVGHGTHVASIACAAANNAVGIAGAGLGCRLLVVKSDLSEGSVVRSIVWAADNGAHAINMSFGTTGEQPASQAVVDAIEYAVARGAVPVAAAADEPVEEQGDPSNVLQPTGSGGDLAIGLGLSVTAANANDQRASFAGRGSQISMAAYGALQTSGPPGLLAAFPGNQTSLEQGVVFPPQPGCNCRTAFDGDNRYAYLQGTSMAAPMVAAVAAMVRAFNPDLGTLEVVRLMKETARRPSGAQWQPDLGWGILDAGAAVIRARSIDRRPPASKLTAPRAPRSGRITLRWSGRDKAPPGVTRSGIARYEVWRSTAGRRYRRIARTRRSSMRVRVARGTRYRLYTIAVDKQGNREPVPSRADASVRAR